MTQPASMRGPASAQQPGYRRWLSAANTSGPPASWRISEPDLHDMPVVLVRTRQCRDTAAGLKEPQSSSNAAL
jgi:hypothetical protein